MKRRRRVSRDRVAANARQQASTGRMDWLNLPPGVSLFQPDAPKTLRLDIIPYEVQAKNHPDRVEPGCLWYKLPFAIHYNLGVDAKSVVCPGSFGARCPVCEEKARLAKDWDENEEMVRSLTPQKWVIYNIVDQGDSEKVSVFAFSRGKFAAFFENELMEGDEDNLNFYDVTSEGRTIKVRFSKDSYAGKEFIKATRMDFLPRDEMDEAEVLGKVVELTKCLVILSYAEVRDLFEGSGESEEAGTIMSSPEEDSPEEGEPAPSVANVAKGKGGAEREKKKAVDDDFDGDDFDDKEALPKGKSKPKEEKEKKVEKPDPDDGFDDGWD